MKPSATRVRASPAIAFAALLIIVPLIAFAATLTQSSTAQDTPRFARMEIDIWPEFDRHAALVILKGELAPDVPLPAAVSLRIPASSGGPSAVAFANVPKGNLLNLAHTQIAREDFITVRFQTPERFVHVEFYDPLVTATPDRAYTYVWQGDFHVDNLSLRLQEPASADNISAQPALAASGVGADGLRYRSAELGAFGAGKALPIKIRYSKADRRTSAEILGLKVPDTASPSPAANSDSGNLRPPWLIGLLGVLLVSTAAVGGSLWWWRGGRAVAKPQAAGTAFCHQCGNGLESGDRFCPACGAPVRAINIAKTKRTGKSSQ